MLEVETERLASLPFPVLEDMGWMAKTKLDEERQLFLLVLLGKISLCSETLQICLCSSLLVSPKISCWPLSDKSTLGKGNQRSNLKIYIVYILKVLVVRELGEQSRITCMSYCVFFNYGKFMIPCGQAEGRPSNTWNKVRDVFMEQHIWTVSQDSSEVSF